MSVAAIVVACALACYGLAACLALAVLRLLLNLPADFVDGALESGPANQLLSGIPKFGQRILRSRATVGVYTLIKKVRGIFKLPAVIIGVAAVAGFGALLAGLGLYTGLGILGVLAALFVPAGGLALLLEMKLRALRARARELTKSLTESAGAAATAAVAKAVSKE